MPTLVHSLMVWLYILQVVEEGFDGRSTSCGYANTNASNDGLALHTEVVEEGIYGLSTSCGYCRYVCTEMWFQCIPRGIVIYICSLRVCANANAFDDCLGLHTQVFKESFDGHCTGYEAFADMYAKFGLFIVVLNLFGGIKFRSNASWTSFIVGYGEHDAQEETLKCFD